MIHSLCLLFLTLTVANICVVAGNVTLIADVCNDSPALDACTQCLFNNSGAEYTKKDLALRTLECSQGMITTIAGDLWSISKSSDDYGVKGRCLSCRNRTKVVGSQSLENATSFMNEDQFPDAAKQVAVAIDEWDSCRELISDLLGLPPIIIQHFNYLKDLYLVAKDIIMKLPVSPPDTC